MTTTTGENRNKYANAHPDDPRPSRFSNQGRDYRAWAERADVWAAATLPVAERSRGRSISEVLGFWEDWLPSARRKTTADR